MSTNHKNVSRIGVLLIIVMVFSVISLPDQTFAAKKKKVKTITFENAKNYRKVIKKGKKVKLKVTVSPKGASKKMKFVSSNKKIATVSKKGTIKAKKKGSCYVTAYAKDGSKKKKKIKVMVGTPTTSVKISGDNVVMNKNTTKLKASVSPSKASYKKLTWKSSNKKVVTVNSSGKVTWKKNGTATITASTADGTKVKGSMKITAATLSQNETNYIAHRGYSNKAPENSLAAFDLAGKTGFQGIECDIWEVDKKIEVTTKEGIGVSDDDPPEPEKDFVVFHDETLNRMTGINGTVVSKTFEELTDTPLINGNGISTYRNETIPSFEEFLDTIKMYPNARPVIEIKSFDTDTMITPTGAAMISDMLKERNLSGKASVISFGQRALKTFKAADPNIHTMYLASANGMSFEEKIDWAYENDIDCVSISSGNLTKSHVDKIHSLGMEAAVYTVDTQRKAYDFVREMGVDWITSNGKLWR